MGGIYVRIFRNRNRFLAVFLMLGFIVGILYANMISDRYVTASGIFSEYFLNQYVQTEIIAEEYMWSVIRARVFPFLTVCILGCTKWKKILVGAVLGWTGFAGGMLAVSAVMRLGIKGLVLCAAGIFPQALFYILPYTVLLLFLYQYPEGRWNTGKTIVICLSFVIGILLETYVNPMLMKLVIKAF